MVGEITLPVKVKGVTMPMYAHVLWSKGPPLIMGFTFLEANQLLVQLHLQNIDQEEQQGAG